MKKTICVLSKFRADGVVKNSISPEGNQIYKMIPLKFGCNVPAYVFERASPFIPKFESTFLRMYESGIYYWILKENESKSTHDTQINKKVVNNLLLMSIVIIWTVGLTISTIMFLIEIIFHYLFSIRLLQVKNEKFIIFLEKYLN